MLRHIALLALVACGSNAGPSTPTSPRDPAVTGSPTPAHEVHASTTAAVGEVAHEDSATKCEPSVDLNVDGLIDEWKGTRVFSRVGVLPDGVIEMHCAWDGQQLALMFDVKDDRVIRVKGGHEDHITVSLAAGGRPLAIDVYPGNSMAKPKITKPAKVMAADSLQPGGFSVEIGIPASAIPDFSPSTPQFQLDATFHDSDAATGGDTTPLRINDPIVLGDRKDLLDDFLATVKLKKSDIKLDTLVDLDPDHAGKERIVAGGTIIGVLTDQYGYVSLPVDKAADVTKVELIPLGPKGSQIISAIVHQTGNGGARDLLMLWTVWSGQLQPLVAIEVKKEMTGNVLESSWKIVKGKKGPELVVEAKPAVGFTADNYAEEPADDADGILVPWDTKRSGIAYSVTGKSIERHDLPPAKKKH